MGTGWIMSKTQARSSDSALGTLDDILPELEVLYKDLRSHPELSMQEARTAGVVADRLQAAGYEISTGIGKTGVAGVLRTSSSRRSRSAAASAARCASIAASSTPAR